MGWRCRSIDKYGGWFLHVEAFIARTDENA